VRFVVGGATGMGAAAARVVRELGATVTVMDCAPVTYDTDQKIRIDLRVQRSIDDVIAALGGPVNAVFAADLITGRVKLDA
jgi:NAD(P)-dependent dehydrogenase (short-subunit alcohol dehydrogenase family)